MDSPTPRESLDALRDIRGIMDRSTRFVSLSGWSGVWAGCVALVSAGVAGSQFGVSLREIDYLEPHTMPFVVRSSEPLIWLAFVTFLVAFVGSFFFTWRKAQQTGQKVWSRSAQRLMVQVVIPIAAGGAFCLAALHYGDYQYIAPACLIFYGLALVNGSKFTLGEVRWLGYLEIILGAANLFLPGWSLILWAAGFGVLHILYGLVMWRRYDSAPAAGNA